MKRHAFGAATTLLLLLGCLPVVSLAQHMVVGNGSGLPGQLVGVDIRFVEGSNAVETVDADIFYDSSVLTPNLSACGGTYNGSFSTYSFSCTNPSSGRIHISGSAPFRGLIDSTDLGTLRFTVAASASAQTVVLNVANEAYIKCAIPKRLGPKGSCGSVPPAPSTDGSIQVVVPSFELERASVPIANGGIDDLGTQPPGITDVTWTIRNTGDGALTVNTPAPGSPLNLDAVLVIQAPSGTVAPGGSTTFTVRIDPAAPGPFSFDLSISHSDLGNSPFVFDVLGAVPDVSLTSTLEATGLLTDNDGDGQANPSDTITFAVSLTVTGDDPIGEPVDFSMSAPAFATIIDAAQMLGAGGTLVFDGTSLSASFTGLSGGGASYQDLIVLDVLVDNTAIGRSLEFQGNFAYAGQGTATDDPGRPGPADPTRIDIGILQRIVPGGQPDRFGSAVVMGEDFAVVSSPGSGGGVGLLYLYRVNDEGLLSFLRTIAPPVGFAGIEFGASLALDGNRLVVGSMDPPETAKGVTGAKAAVYDLLNDGTPALAAQIITNLQTGFGSSVAIDGDMIAVGAPGEDHSGTRDAGAVYLYSGDELVAGSTLPMERLTSPSTEESGQFGAAVAAGGGKVAIGAPGPGGGSSGSAALYDAVTRNLGGLTVPAAGEGEFGAAVAIAGATVVVGAPSASGRGAVVEYGVSEGEVSTPRTIVPDETASDGARFGSALALDRLDRNILYVGAPNAVVPTAGGQGAFGAIYEYDPARLQANRIGAFSTSGSFVQQDRFGSAIAALGRALLVGAPATATNRGEAAYRLQDIMFADSFE